MLEKFTYSGKKIFAFENVDLDRLKKLPPLPSPQKPFATIFKVSKNFLTSPLFPSS